MRKVIWSVLAIIIIVLLVIVLSSRNNGSRVQLVALIPLSGGNASQGVWMQRGFDIALDEINKTSKNKLDVLYEDTQGIPKNAVGAYTDLANRYKAPVVFSWGSGVGLALTPLVNKDKVVHIGIATAVPTYSTPNDFTFRDFPSSEMEADFLADVFIKDVAAKRVVVLKINNDYGLGSAKSFSATYIKKGGKILADESFEPNGSDFRTVLTKIKQLNPDYIFISSYPKEGALVLRQAKDLGITAKFIASTAIAGADDFFRIAGDSANGLLVVNAVPIPDPNDEQTNNFFATYKNKYGEEIGTQQLSARSYDSLKIVSKIIDTCNTDTNCIKDELYKVSGYKGVAGDVTFDNNGDIKAYYELQLVKDGKFTWLNRK